MSDRERFLGSNASPRLCKFYQSVEVARLWRISCSPRCTQINAFDAIGKDQGNVTKAIERLIEIGLLLH